MDYKEDREDTHNREQFDNTLDNVSIKQEDGSVVPFKSAAKKKTKEDNKSE